MLALSPARLFTGAEIVEGATVQIENGRIAALCRDAPAGALRLDGLLAPGLIDIQVNGGGGVLFNDAPNAAALETIAAAHRRFGVTGFMATLISDERGKAEAAFDAVAQAIAGGLDGLLGLHLEGPWLSAPRRGVHPSEFLRPLDESDLRLLTQPRAFPLLVTLAPEQAGPDTLRQLKAAGVTISLGHTAASAEEIDAALAAGASGFTHLYNGMPPLEGRRPGAVGAALADKHSYAGLILDGVHVHPHAARIAFACKSARQLMLVSDAMATLGAETSAMTLFGEKIALKDGALRTTSGTLAGAHLDLSSAMRNAVSMIGATPEEALRMASLTPAEFLGVQNERGRIAPGARADFVLLDEQLDVQSVWIGGRQLH